MSAADDMFGAIDRAVAEMPPVERACNTCAYADVPPMPEILDDGWMGHCTAPVPANTLLNPSPVMMSITGADVVRWEGKRLKPCPAWLPKN